MGIKPFDVRRIGGTGLINPEQLGYQDSLNIIREELHRTRRSFVKIGWYLKHIREKEMYKEEDYANVYELAADKFNLSQPTATRFINICEQFSIGHDSPELDEKYLDFNMSQLFEMLPMNPEEMSRVTPDMTVSQIRDYKKRNRGEETVPDNEEIPGQTSIREDFKELMPDDYGKEVVDVKCREVLQEPKAEVGTLQQETGGQPHDENWIIREFKRLQPAMAEEIREVYYGEDEGKRAKAVQKYLSPYGCFHTGCAEYSFDFYSFDKGLDLRVGAERKHFTYARFAKLIAGDGEVATSQAGKATPPLGGQSKEEPKQEEEICQEEEVLSAYGLPKTVYPEGSLLTSERSLKSIAAKKEKEEETGRPEMPQLKNDAQRKKWLRNYKEWGLWYRDENIDVNYYKYDFEDGSRLIVAEYPQRQRDWQRAEEDEYYLHLLEKEKERHDGTRYNKQYLITPDWESYLVEFLKKVQKQKK